jgi:hypothetical protein
MTDNGRTLQPQNQYPLPQLIKVHCNHYEITLQKIREFYWCSRCIFPKSLHCAQQNSPLNWGILQAQTITWKQGQGPWKRVDTDFSVFSPSTISPLLIKLLNVLKIIQYLNQKTAQLTINNYLSPTFLIYASTSKTSSSGKYVQS